MTLRETDLSFHWQSQLVRNIRSDIPVLLCAGYRQVAKPEEIETAGIGRIVSEHATSKDLARAIRSLMDRRG